MLVPPVLETKHTQLGPSQLRFSHADQEEHSGRDVSKSRDHRSLAHEPFIKDPTVRRSERTSHETNEQEKQLDFVRELDEWYGYWNTGAEEHHFSRWVL